MRRNSPVTVLAALCALVVVSSAAPLPQPPHAHKPLLSQERVQSDVSSLDIYPVLGPVDQWVYVFGDGFVADNTSVRCGNVEATSFVVYDDTQLGFNVPANTDTSFRVTITTPTTTRTTTAMFSVGLPVSAPRITDTSARTVSVGEWVYVYGQNFVAGVGGTQVFVGNVLTSSTVYGADQLGLTVPAEARAYTQDGFLVRVVTANGAFTFPTRLYVNK